MKFAVDQTESSGSNINSLQRSKSLSSADALARGIAGLGLGCVNESNEIGTFKPEIQALVDQAFIDPNLLNARALMVLANQIMQRAIESQRFALPGIHFFEYHEFQKTLLSKIMSSFHKKDLPPNSITFLHCGHY